MDIDQQGHCLVLKRKEYLTTKTQNTLPVGHVCYEGKSPAIGSKTTLEISYNILLKMSLPPRNRPWLGQCDVHKEGAGGFSIVSVFLPLLIPLPFAKKC